MVCRLSLVVALLWLLMLAASLRPAHAEQAEIRYAPVENLERVDVGLLRSARAKIDMAAYSLTDWAVIDALFFDGGASNETGNADAAMGVPNLVEPTRRRVGARQRQGKESLQHLRSGAPRDHFSLRLLPVTVFNRPHSDRILPITDQIAVEWGQIAAIRPRGDVDGLIAATAIVHDLIVVTRTTADFDDTGASVIDPWDFA